MVSSSYRSSATRVESNLSVSSPRTPDAAKNSKPSMVNPVANTNDHHETSSTAVSSTCVEPVWIQLCLVEKHLASAVTADHMASPSSTVGNQRRVSPSSVKGSSRKSYRDINDSSSSTGAATTTTATAAAGGWGWLFGYASMDTSDSITKKETAAAAAAAHSGGGTQDKIKFHKAPSSAPIISPTNTVSKSWNTRNHHGNDLPRTVRIHDEFNMRYNNTVLTVSNQEYRDHVLPANGNTRNSSSTQHQSHTSHPFIPPKNLIELVHLHEPSLVQSLHIRYAYDQVYTHCGPILLALNPFTHIPRLYGDEVIQTYRHCSMHTYDASSNTSSVYESVEPHIYSIADAAFLAMQASIATSREQNRAIVGTGNKRNHPPTSTTANTSTKGRIPMDQSILISGESGAGKTYNTKMAMRYLASISRQHMVVSSPSSTLTSTFDPLSSSSPPKSMEQQVLQSNPILESFGNARTVRNDNSSRFGKLINIKFHYSGYILGASIDTYLLEKVRLVRQAPGERNYHIFYQLLFGLIDSNQRHALGIQGCTVEDFKITCMSGTFDRRDGVCDTSTYRELVQALDTVGFSSQEQEQLFHVITGLLHMSNIDFHENTESSDSSNVNIHHPSLNPVLHLLGVQIQSLNQALCTCTLTVRGEVMIKKLNVDKAEKAKEALMKATYGALFEYIVYKVNQSMSTTTTKATATAIHDNDCTPGIQENAHIKILDIFGFESFHINSFEQLCINYCNEALQQQFNRFVFKMEQEEYEREGIEWLFIEFPDNQDILDLIERKHVGILSLLDEQCRLAKCSDQTFASATYEKCVDHPRFSSDKRQQASGLFQIHHYAGPVEYSTVSFLDKNKDELPKEATDFLLSSSMPFLKELGQRLNEKNSYKSMNTSAQKSVGSQFSTQLRELRDEIDKTNPHYVRCLKPNDDLVAGYFVPEVVADQLRAAGVLEAVRVSRIGFPQRYTHNMFVQRYGLLASPSVRKAGKRARISDYCSMLVQDLLPRVKGSHSTKEKSVSLGVQMGLTKVFLRQFAFDSLEKMRTEQLSSAATSIQCLLRMFFCKVFYIKLKSSAIIIQKTQRMYLAKSFFRMLRREWASVKIQSIWRGFICFSDFSTQLFAILWTQRNYRGIKIRRVYRIMLQETKAVAIQSWWRMSNNRKRFVSKRCIAFNLQQLYRCRKSKRILKELKIESRSLSKVVKERDEFKKELLRMKKELEAAKTSSQNDSSKSIISSIDKLCGRSPLSVLQKELANETASFVSSACNESLISEMVRKDKEIELLRREIEYLKQPRLSMNASTTEISTTDISLLDNEYPYRQQTHKEIPHPFCDEIYHDEYELSEVSISFENHIHLAVHASDEDALSVAVSCATDLTCELNQGGLFGRTPLHLAVMSSKVSIIQLLLENECVTNAQDELGNTPLHYATSEFICKILLEKGKCNPNIPNNDGWCCLHNAVKRLDFESCRILLRHGSSIIAADHSRWLTPLHVLMLTSANADNPNQSSSRVLGITKLLCEQETIVMNEPDNDGSTALHYASTATHERSCDVINQLLRCGANPNIVNSRGQSPLHLWLHNRNVFTSPSFVDTIHLFLKYGADVNIQTHSGCTPLHLAVYHENLKIATIFLSEANGQLHIPWRKPESWKKHWNSPVSSETFCLDMTQEIRLLIHAIRCKQTFAPQRPCCMHCKSEFRGLTRRQVNCDHCGSRICSSCCAKGKIDSSYLPKYCNDSSSTSKCITSKCIVCKICEDCLVNVKYTNI